MPAKLLENNEFKIFKSTDYNYIFNKNNGAFVRWGKTKEDDPEFSPYGPEIADIEISTICNGVNGIGPCKFCYKSNTKNGKYMSFETFKDLFSKLPHTITQIAFGIGDINGNPDMWDIFDFCKNNGIIPNVTVNGENITDDIADKLVSKCGAIAVSVYDKNKTYDTIKKLTDRGLKQCNIHYMISEQTYDGAIELINDTKTDERLSKLNAIVLLSLKKKGRAINNSFTSLSQDKFKKLVEYAMSNNVIVGFDSCSQYKFIQSVKDHPNFKVLEMQAEPCESTKFSLYINTEGKFFPCSFMEGEESTSELENWTEGLNVLSCTDFVKDIWYNEKTKNFRKKCIECTQSNGGCSHYTI